MSVCVCECLWDFAYLNASFLCFIVSTMLLPSSHVPIYHTVATAQTTKTEWKGHMAEYKHNVAWKWEMAIVMWTYVYWLSKCVRQPKNFIVNVIKSVWVCTLLGWQWQSFYIYFTILSSRYFLPCGTMSVFQVNISRTFLHSMHVHLFYFYFSNNKSTSTNKFKQLSFKEL